MAKVAAEVYPEFLNTTASIIDENIAKGRGDKVAYYFEEEPLGRKSGSVTFNELRTLTSKAGNFLKSLGIRPGDRVGVVGFDSIEYIVSFFGVMRMGGVSVAIPPILPPDTMKYILKDSDARAVITFEQALESIEKIRGDLKYLEHVIVIGTPAKSDELSYDKLMEEAPPELEPEEVHRDDMAFFCYSSGTTGAPKGCVHLQHDLPWNADTYGIPMWRITEKDIFLGTWPIFFAAGWFVKGGFFPRAGAAVLLWPGNPPGRPQVEDYLSLIQKYKVTILGGVPTFLTRILQIEDFEKKYDLSSLRLIVSGAEPLIPSMADALEQKLPGVKVLDVLGLTDTGYLLSGEIDSKSRGLKPGPGVEVKLVDEEGKEITEPDKEGTLLVKSDAVSAFYWKKHEKTKKTYKGEWFDTGDVYVRDKEGYLWYRGRADEMIRQKGFWVSPKKVEDAATEHKAVLEAAAVQSYDEGGLPMAKLFVVLKEGFSPSPELAQEIRDFLKSKLSFFEVPGAVEFTDTLPRLPTGKVSRLILARQEAEKAKKKS